MVYELIIQNGLKLFSPLVVGDITLSIERRGSPGKLSFKVLKDEALDITEGNAVRLSVDGTGVFYGFIFTRKPTKDKQVEVIAYDQIRYLKNKDTYVYENKRASELVKMIADDFDLQAGSIAQTEFVIESRVEDNASLMDIIYNALDLELRNNKNMFVLYDDFGKLVLRNISDMRLNLLIDADTAESYDYSISIDDNTYNKIKLYKDGTDARDVYIAQDGQHMNDWGILQLSEKLEEGEDGKTKADALLSLYNAKTRKLKVSKAFGDIRVRGGTLLPVILQLDDVSLTNFMLVEKVTHTFSLDHHSMDLTLRGGEFIA